MDKENSKTRTAANRMLLIETIAVGFCSLCLFVFANSPVRAYSALLGGGAFIGPNVLFVRLSLWKSATDTTNSKILMWFYIGETIKIAATIIIFLISLLFVKPLSIGTMFISYGAVALMNLAGLAVLMNR